MSSASHIMPILQRDNMHQNKNTEVKVSLRLLEQKEITLLVVKEKIQKKKKKTYKCFCIHKQHKM